jgi:hypothetical protein
MPADQPDERHPEGFDQESLLPLVGIERNALGNEQRCKFSVRIAPKVYLSLEDRLRAEDDGYGCHW